MRAFLLYVVVEPGHRLRGAFPQEVLPYCAFTQLRWRCHMRVGAAAWAEPGELPTARSRGLPLLSSGLLGCGRRVLLI